MAGHLQTDFMILQPPSPAKGIAWLVALFERLTPPKGHPLAPTTYSQTVWIQQQVGRQEWLVPYPAAGGDYPNGFTLDYTFMQLPETGFPRTLVSWGRSVAKTPKCMTWGGVSTDGNIAPPPDTVPIGTIVPPTDMFAEAYEVLKGKGVREDLGAPGKILMDLRRAHDHILCTDPTSPPKPTFARATAFYGSWAGFPSENLQIAFTDTGYLVDPVADAAWITINPLPITYLQDWEYPGDDPLHPVGTPVGKYELRAACQNASSPFTHTFDPTTTLPTDQQTLTSSFDIGCFRWDPNLGWDPTDPASAPYNVTSYGYTITIPAAPPGAPDGPTGISTWDSIAHVPTVVDRQPDTQRAQYSHLGVEYLEDTNELVWLIEKQVASTYDARYRYACSFTVQTFDGSTSVHTGHIYQFEHRVWAAIGLRVRHNGADIQVDYPAGVTAIVRTDEGPFPSQGGFLSVSAPTDTPTQLGMVSGRVKPFTNNITDKSSAMVPWGFGRPGGSYRLVKYVWTLGPHPQDQSAVPWYLTDGSSDVALFRPKNADTPFLMADAATIGEDPKTGAFYVGFGSLPI